MTDKNQSTTTCETMTTSLSFFGFLADKIVMLYPDNMVIVTKGEHVLYNKPDSQEDLSPEETDTRI